MVVTCLLLVLFSTTKADSCVVNTFAGTGGASVGSSGDNGQTGPATAAQFRYNTGLWANTGSNLFVGDWTGGMVREVNLGNGIISLTAGNNRGDPGADGDGLAATNTAVKLFAHNMCGLTTGEMYIMSNSYNNQVNLILFIFQNDSSDPVSFPFPFFLGALGLCCWHHLDCCQRGCQ